MTSSQTQLPEDIIVSDILVKLPIKSLLRFTSVSKRYRFIISHPHFAASHFHLSPHRRLLLSTPQVNESVDLNTTPFSSSFSPLTSKLNIKLIQRSHMPLYGRSHFDFFNLEPINWLLPCFSSSEEHAVLFGGFGYLSDSDDYKVVVAVDNVFDYAETLTEVKVLSWRTRVWTTVVVGMSSLSYTLYPWGVLLGETLHWFRNDRHYSAIVAFDLGKEEFGEMREPPNSGERYDRDYVHCVAEGCLGGKLHVFRYPAGVCDVLELWRMGESWVEVFRVSLVDEPRKAVYLQPLLLDARGGAVVAKVTRNATMEMVRIEEHDGEGPVVADVLKREVVPAMIVYEESLHRLPGCDVEEVKAEESRKSLALVGLLVSLYYIPVNVVQMFSGCL